MANPQAKSMTISEKMALLQEIDKKTASKGILAKKYGIPNSTLSTILKNRTKIENGFYKFKENSTRKRTVTAKNEELELKLFDFFSQLRAANLPITGPLLVEKAKTIANTLEITDFKGSNGWLRGFKNRFNITCLAVCGEAQKVNENEVSSWLQLNKPVFEKYSAKDIYNMDETGLFLTCYQTGLWLSEVKNALAGIKAKRG